MLMAPILDEFLSTFVKRVTDFMAVKMNTKLLGKLVTAVGGSTLPGAVPLAASVGFNFIQLDEQIKASASASANKDSPDANAEANTNAEAGKPSASGDANADRNTAEASKPAERPPADPPRFKAVSSGGQQTQTQAENTAKTQTQAADSSQQQHRLVANAHLSTEARAALLKAWRIKVKNTDRLDALGGKFRFTSTAKFGRADANAKTEAGADTEAPDPADAQYLPIDGELAIQLIKQLDTQLTNKLTIGLTESLVASLSPHLHDAIAPKLSEWLQKALSDSLATVPCCLHSTLIVDC